ncbi:hypothetical protein HELRODRAFT_90476, partial [Helobdella robusta]|uniref:Peptidase M14 domain-containing protein n=1 Tax=Helobdella robusta TaxID=6412 RepID=T1G7R9_HELRO
QLLIWMEETSKRFKKYCSLFDVGKSFHGKPLRALKVSIIGRSNKCKQKPSIWIDSGTHAREWITVSTSTFLIDKLLSEYKKDKWIKKLRNLYDWYFLVTLNPDGYIYSWEENRMWRKSRTPTTNEQCPGIDINRNFDFKWMTVGASADPCSESYAGPKANSEPETRAVTKFILSKGPIWDLFITLHSYGQIWMSSWGYTKELPKNYFSLKKVGMAGVNAIHSTNGKRYKFGSASNILYSSSGTSRDWASGVPKIPYVYTIELRNKSSFILPPSEILPTGNEILAGIKAAIIEMQTEYPAKCKDH